MEALDKTLFTNNEDDLKKIYEEEVKKLHENEFKLSLLKRLSVEDFPRELPDESMKTIEKALLAVRIKDHISFENGQKLLGELTSVETSAGSSIVVVLLRIRRF